MDKKVKLTDEKWVEIYNVFKIKLSKIEFPIVIKSNPMDNIEKGFATEDNYSCLQSKLIPLPNCDCLFLDKKEFEVYKKLFNNKSILMLDSRFPKFIVDITNTVEWNIRGFNTVIKEKHNEKISKHLLINKKLTNDKSESIKFENEIYKLFKWLYNEILNECNSEKIEREVPNYFLKSINVNSYCSISDYLESHLSTSSLTINHGNLTRRNCLKGARNLKYQLLHDNCNTTFPVL